MTKTFTVLVTIAVLALTGFGFRAYQKHQAIERELVKVRKAEQEIKALESELKENIEIPDDLEEQIKTLEEENRELHKLRNEVRQLREQSDSLDQLKLRNKQLVETIQRSKQSGEFDADALGFISSDRWRDVGLNTPEEALTTFFHYLSQGKIADLVPRSTLKNSNQNPFEKLSPEEIEKASQSVKEFTSNIQGFRIDRIDRHSETQITVQIQTALNGAAIPIELLKHGNEWRLNMDGQAFF